mgnify:CR=1 FL=1
MPTATRFLPLAMAAVFAMLALLALAPGAARAETWVAGPDGAPMSFQQALARAGDGDVIELLPGLHRGQVGVITQRQLTIRGMGEGAVIEGNGQSAEGRALWIVRGGEVTIENVEFRGARVPDGSGAGLRFEGGRLLLRGCRFVDNEHGLTTGNDTDAELRIVASEFAGAPRIEGSLPHLLHAGRIALLEVTGSRFHQGFEGHMLKSRARVSRIAYNLIVDGQGGEASYEIDLPNGGDALVIGNIVSQSRGTQNPVVVAYGAEGRAWDVNRLLLSHNTLVSHFPLAWFLRAWPERLTPDTSIRAVNNLTVGLGVFGLGASGSFDGNRSGLMSSLEDPAALAFELRRDSRLRGRAKHPRELAGDEAVPQAEFLLPVGTRPLQEPTAWSPGALQR